jgi:lysine 2,3-aminomutase
MDRFIGRKGVFLPRIIIVDEKGNHIETTNRTKLPVFEKMKKSTLLNYEMFSGDMPLTNPVDILSKLDAEFNKSH